MIFLGLLLLLLVMPVGTLAERPGYVTVLLYHRFEEPDYPSTNISSEKFRQQLEYLRQESYRVISMDEFRTLLAAKEPFPPKTVLITIDDPYYSIYEHAFPLLKEYEYPFTLFANVSPLYSKSPAYMDWSQVEEMRVWGATVANHTYYHPHIGKPEMGQTPAQYKDWVRGDLQRAQKAFEEHGMASDILAYPFGEYNETVISVAVELGFKLMFTQDEGGVDERTDPRLIPRVAIVGANLDMERFAFKLDLAPLHVAEVEPDDFRLEFNPPEQFSLRLLAPERYRPGIINMFISEWDRVEAQYEAKTGILSYRPDRPLTRSLNRLIVTAREREGGRFSIYSRLYLEPFPESGEE